MVRRRLKETVTVLDSFASMRQAGRSRADYIDQVRKLGWCSPVGLRPCGMCHATPSAGLTERVVTPHAPCTEDGHRMRPAQRMDSNLTRAHVALRS